MSCDRKLSLLHFRDSLSGHVSNSGPSKIVEYLSVDLNLFAFIVCSDHFKKPCINAGLLPRPAKVFYLFSLSVKNIGAISRLLLVEDLKFSLEFIVEVKLLTL